MPMSQAAWLRLSLSRFAPVPEPVPLLEEAPMSAEEEEQLGLW